MINGIFAAAKLDYAPIIVRITALVVILAYIYDFFSRREARRLISALKRGGAVGPETALKLGELPGVGPLSYRLLSEGSSLRRVVFAANAPQSEASTADGRKKSGKRQKPRKENTKALRFYLPPREERSRELPALLRNGGERGVLRLVIGVVLAIIASELIVYFFPQLKALVTSSGELFN